MVVCLDCVRIDMSYCMSSYCFGRCSICCCCCRRDRRRRRVSSRFSVRARIGMNCFDCICCV